MENVLTCLCEYVINVAMSKHKYWYKCPKCEKVLFEMDRMPEAGDIVRAEEAYLPDGSRPVNGTPIVCQHCGTGLRGFVLPRENIIAY